MDRVSVVALFLAGASVVVTAVNEGDVSVSVRHACLLLLPLAAIAFPESMEAGYRRSWGGLAHGGEGPTPATMIRIVAWGLLIVLVVAQYVMTTAEHAAWTPGVPAIATMRKRQQAL